MKVEAKIENDAEVKHSHPEPFSLSEADMEADVPNLALARADKANSDWLTAGRRMIREGESQDYYRGQTAGLLLAQIVIANNPLVGAIASAEMQMVNAMTGASLELWNEIREKAGNV